MTDTPLETVLRRDRDAVLVALLLLTMLAWAYLLWLSLHMVTPHPAMPDMPGMDRNAMEISAMAMEPRIRSWNLTELSFSFAIWAVMMAGMMMPSAAPMILLYARVGRQAQAQQKPFAATGWFAGGYLLAWMVFSLLAAMLQAALSRAALLTPMLTTADDVMGGGILVIAGIFQWSSLKNRCLTNCRAPLHFLQRHGGFKREAAASLGLGFRHGLYCVGCCWALMLLLFAGGIMNLVWIAGLAVLVLFEKILTDGRNFSRVIGLALIIAGLLLIYDRLVPAA